ncbi:MAG: acetyl-coenzyme-A carboxylase [Watsoniomyces obsoletus]|nr:MAG: acetyl-coenzyme-A carboxylase [Watsoniomyces obsoletus]
MSITRWILDTRPLWREGIFEHEAEPYLSLLRPEERHAILRFYHVKDRAMSLGSWLCKYHAISRSANQPWPSIVISKDPRTHKPCYIPNPDQEGQAVQFNVSHQAGRVAMVSSPGNTFQLGIDIVCVHERDEYRLIDTMGEGFREWVNMHAEVFSEKELEDITCHLPELHRSDGTILSNAELGDATRCCTRHVMLTIKRSDDGEELVVNSNGIIEAKIRRFYAFWALKEAYVKMTGDALLADWLKEVEFRNVRAPRPSRNIEGEKWGEVVKDVQIYLRGELVKNVQMELQAFEENYMIATAVSRFEDNSLEVDKERNERMEHKDELMSLLPPFEMLDLERDVMSQAGGRPQETIRAK